MKKILVIDDEAWLREMVQMALETRGFEVLIAENGAEGIKQARAEVPSLILCDVNMQQVDGYGTLASLRADPATAPIPFILMTGLADHAGMRHGMELGADDYLPKPFTIDGLFAAVDVRLRKADLVREQAEKKLADLRDSISLMLPHELRTPLNGILAFGEVLARDSGSLEPKDLQEIGGILQESAKRLESLVENFLIYAQIEMLSSDAHKIAALRTKVTAKPSLLVARHAKTKAEYAGRMDDLYLEVDDLPLRISEEYLAKITDELTENALKFSKAGTPVKIELSSGDQFAELSIIDEGRGFTTADITRVGAYMQFDRKMHEQEGQGLGLAISRRLAEIHGGSLKIQSVPGGGSTITIRLPKAAASQLVSSERQVFVEQRQASLQPLSD
jgi:signal transduction histidine kinase